MVLEISQQVARRGNPGRLRCRMGRATSEMVEQQVEKQEAEQATELWGRLPATLVARLLRVVVLKGL